MAKNGAFWLQQTVIHIMNMLQSKSCTKLTRDQCVRSFCEASTASGTQSVHSLIITRTQCEQKRCTIAHIAVLAQPSCSQSNNASARACMKIPIHLQRHSLQSCTLKIPMQTEAQAALVGHLVRDKSGWSTPTKSALFQPRHRKGY